MNAPDLSKQNGTKGGTGRVTRGVRSGGTNQGKVATSGNRRYTAHPRKAGQ